MKKQRKESSGTAKDPSSLEDNCTVVRLKESHKKLQQKKFVKFIVNNSKSF